MNTSIDKQFDGKFSVENRYDYLNLNTCRFLWKQVKFPLATDASNAAVQVLKEGEVQGSDVAAHSAGVLDIRTNILADTDALYLTAIDKYGHELWRWTFPVNKLNQQTEQLSPLSSRPTYTETENDLTVKANKRTFIFSKKDGQLKGVSVDNRKINFANGPVSSGPSCRPLIGSVL